MPAIGLQHKGDLLRVEVFDLIDVKPIRLSPRCLFRQSDGNARDIQSIYALRESATLVSNGV